MNDLPKKISQRRKMQRLTQAQLAERVGITQAFLAEIEKGRKRPSLEVLEKLCGALGCSADYLLGLPPGRQYHTLRESEPEPATGITEELLHEIAERHISSDELMQAIRLVSTIKDNGGRR